MSRLVSEVGHERTVLIAAIGLVICGTRNCRERALIFHLIRLVNRLETHNTKGRLLQAWGKYNLAWLGLVC